MFAHLVDITNYLRKKKKAGEKGGGDHTILFYVRRKE